MSKDYSMTCDACGAATTRFEVLRVGSDVRIVCLGCGRDVTVPRLKLEKSIKKIVPAEEKQ